MGSRRLKENYDDLVWWIWKQEGRNGIGFWNGQNKKKKKEILRKCQGICENLKIIASSSRMVLSFTFT